MLQIRDLAGDGSRVWCATDGGLLAFDADRQSFQAWTNTEGLAANEMAAVIRDNVGRLWLGFSNGLLQRFDPDANRWSVYDDFKGHSILCLKIQGDSLFVGLDIGISLFIISRQEVKETYRRLGDLFQIEIPVSDIWIREKQIWAATGMGAAYSNLQDNNLLDPKNWTNITKADGLPANEITRLFHLGNEMVLGTSAGAVLEEGDHWTLLSNGFPGGPINDFAEFNGFLVAATPSGVFKWDGQNWSPYIQGPSACLSLAFSENRQLIGTQNGIWETSSPELPATHHVPNCPISSQINDLEYDLSGNLWCASGQGFFRFGKAGWTRFELTENSEMNNAIYRCIAVDPHDHVWLGTWGRGLVFAENDTTFRVYNVKNGYLSTSDLRDTDYPAVSDVAIDQNRTLWLLNYNSMSNLPLISISEDTVWTYYGSSDGISVGTLLTLAVDQYNRKWIGTKDNGILIVDDNGTPWDKSDDAEVERLTTADGLSSNTVNAIAVDHDGTVWIGTDKGLHYFSFGELRQINPYIQDAITALMVDGVNNLWVGTHIGVGYVSISTWAVTHFTTENSPLVSNQITSLTYNPQSGTVDIGTGKGISHIETPFSQTVPDMKALNLYPNPFFPDRDETLTIEGLSKGVAVSVYTLNGIRVRGYPLGNSYGRRIFWDGKNDRGETVADGIYLIVAQTEDGHRALGKVAVVR
jgi:ligand-binding sensor domain-containing protein